MREHKDIGARLENWSRWCTARTGRGPDCMTGAICDDMRKNSGLVREGHHCIDKIDDGDAVRIEMGMRKITTPQRLLLSWCYIEQARPEVICRKMSIAPRPASVFVDLFRAAQCAIEQIVDLSQQAA